MAFRKKWKAIIKYRPDILVLQECEKESKYKPGEIIPDYNQFIWIGQNENKGVGIISFNNYNIKISENYVDEYKYIIPIKVTGRSTFNLFAIWAMPDKVRARGYVGQIWNALPHYQSELSTNSILIGDFNSNAIWDNDRKKGNHSDVVGLLNQYGIVSLYHELFDHEHGKEPHPTIYLLKKEYRPFHLDYCFASRDMLTDKTKIELGDFKDWLPLSDHIPLIISHLGP